MGRGRKRKDGADLREVETETEHHDEVTRDSNVGNRRDAMASALERVYAIDTEINDIIAEHIKDLRNDKSAIKTSLRERFGLTSKIFQARYYAYKLERDAAAASDEVTQDAIRELFEVCPVTGQGSFGAALDSTRAGDPGSRTAPAMEADNEANDHDRAHDEGRQAGLEGLDVTTCPYTLPRQKKLKATWETGWQEAQEEGDGGAAGEPQRAGIA